MPIKWSGCTWRQVAGGKSKTSFLVNSRSRSRKSSLADLSLLKYWRDAASHGRRSGIADNEAYTALAVLLRFAQFANDRWTDLTGRTSP